MEYVVLFFAQLANVFLKAWQSRNVAHGHTLIAMLTPFILAWVEIYTIGVVAVTFVQRENIHIAYLAMAIGASLGVGSAIEAHKKFVGRKYGSTRNT